MRARAGLRPSRWTGILSGAKRSRRISSLSRVTREAQARNETASHRNVGLVIETRPDWVTPDEVVHLRRLGVTKVQLGVQSLDDRILALNQRGHDVAAVRRAVAIAARCRLQAASALDAQPARRDAGVGSGRLRPAVDRIVALRPDELKIYPCSIIEGTELFRLWRDGQYRPYTDEELLDLVADCKATIPAYCRVNRVFRDIPADDIVAGVKSSNLRQLVHERMAARGQVCGCIRCREIRETEVLDGDLHLVVHEYDTAASREQFIGLETAAGKLAGFLRLSLPHKETFEVSETSKVWECIPEIADARR